MNKNKWLAVSIFSAKDDWPALLNKAIQPLIDLLLDHREIISFDLQFNHSNSEYIKLALLVPAKGSYKVIRKTAAFFKDLFPDNEPRRLSNTRNSNGLFEPYLKTRVYFDLFSTSSLPVSGNLLTLQQALCRSMLDAFSKDAIDDDLILSFCLYLHLGCLKAIPESDRIQYARESINGDNACLDFINDSCNDLSSDIDDVYYDIMNPSTENRLEWLNKWENTFKNIHEPACNKGQGAIFFTNTVALIHKQLKLSKLSTVLLNRLVFKIVSDE